MKLVSETICFPEPQNAHFWMWFKTLGNEKRFV